MPSTLSRSSDDDRTTAGLSTSSHTHVDSVDPSHHSPRTKNTAWSAKCPEDDQIPPPPPVQQEQPGVSHQYHAYDTQQTSIDTSLPRRKSPNQPKKERPPPPKCLQACITSIESCTANVVRFNERMEQSRVQAEAQREENGDPPAARKAIIPMVFVILSWVFLAYAWRLCSRLIQQNPQGMMLGTRAEGIGLLTGFVILWLMTMWSYITVILKGPGLVKDCVPESDPPLAPVQQSQWNGAPPQQPGQLPQSTSQPVPIPSQGRAFSVNAQDRASTAHPGSLQYPSYSADLEQFGGHRASSDSMRVLPGSVEPKHNSITSNLSHSRTMSRCTVVEEEATADTSAAHVDAQLAAAPLPPADPVEADTAATDPQLPGIIGPLGAAAIAEGQAMRDGVEALQQIQSTAYAAPNAEQPAASTWAAPQRRPQNDPPPLSPAALYCHRCRRVKPPRAHHCRRCGTCVLKMDHHCPWVGGCVGARNHRFFFIFVLWVTLLEMYTLITTAIFFHRGEWKVDGFLVSLFPICAMFVIFTGALLCTHLWLMGRNLTTIEHVAANRMQGKERALIDRWFGMQQQGKGGKSGFGGLNLKAKRNMVREWDREWGRLTKEGHRWWLGSSDEANYHIAEAAQGAVSDSTSINAAQEKKAAEGTQARRKGKKRGAWRTNMKQVLGPSLWMWVLPIGKHVNDGLEFPMNPRFGPEGVWRKRDEWPAELR